MNSDDPKITAYALDALSESERLEVEDVMANNGEIRAEVAEVEAVSAALTDAFRMRPQVGLSSAQREAIRDAARANLIVPTPMASDELESAIQDTASGIGDFPPSSLKSPHARFPGPMMAAGIGAIAAGMAVLVAVKWDSGEVGQVAGVVGGGNTVLEESGTMRVQIISGDSSQKSHAIHSQLPRPLPKLSSPEGSFLVDVQIPSAGNGNLQESGNVASLPVRPFEEPEQVAEQGFLDPLRSPLSNLLASSNESSLPAGNSYASVRQALNMGSALPSSVRVGEMIGHFDFSAPAISQDEELSFAAGEVVDCPWQEGHLLARVVLRGADGEFTAEDLQVEFNPSVVESYRLLGFSEEKSGGNVTALYQILPLAGRTELASQPSHSGREGEIELRYGSLASSSSTSTFPAGDPRTRELLVVTTPGEFGAQLPLELQSAPLSAADDDFRFAAAVAGFSVLLNGSSDGARLSYDDVIELAESAIGADVDGERARFVQLVKVARDRQ